MFRFKMVVILIGLWLTGYSICAAEKNDKTTPEYKNIKITEWKLRKKYLNGKHSLRGKIKLKNIGKRELESVKISLELQNSEAVTIKNTEWSNLTAVLSRKKEATKNFTINGVKDFGTLVLYVRYYYAPEGTGEDKTVKIKNIKKSLSEEFDSGSTESIDEMFFSLSLDKPVRYSEESFKKAIDEYNRKAGIKTANEDISKQAVTDDSITLTNLDIEQPDPEKNEKNLIISVENKGKAIDPGQLQLVLIFKDAAGKDLNKIEYICRNAIPKGKSIITIPKQTISNDVQSWEYIYKYF